MTSGLRRLDPRVRGVCVDTRCGSDCRSDFASSEGSHARRRSFTSIRSTLTKAKADRIEGMVIVETVIATDARSRDYARDPKRATSLLDAAAIEAVSQWEFTPTCAEWRAGGDRHEREDVTYRSCTDGLPRRSQSGESRSAFHTLHLDTAAVVKPHRVSPSTFVSDLFAR